ncbi:MAG: AarF/ABC1/UbiB kinase family protein [Candidatus Omnitrophica bacterium]|nr:AarF/ABC1/UbiB kinase family protein [Candidatus Omnitrophota bacterium]
MLPIRNIGRVRQVLTVVTRNGLGYLTDRLLSEPFFRFLKRRKNSALPENTAGERLVSALEELGPTYIKLGQFLSMRPDIFSPPVIDALNRLHEKVKPISLAEVETIIQEELGKPPKEIFREFSVQPLAAASLAQVHSAILPTGEEVAVKVQRPGIKQIIRADLAILAEIASLVNQRIPEARIFNPEDLVTEFEHQLMRELDFQLEAMRIERFRSRFKDDQDLYIPKVFWDYTTEKVLVMERVKGPSPYLEQLKASGILPQETAARIFRTFLKEVFEFGSFHADPHPGNICLCGNQICLVDFGIVGTLTDSDRDVILDIVLSLVEEDLDSLVAAFYRFHLISPEINERLFRREMADLFERYRGLPARRIRLGQFLVDSIRIGRRFNISFPADLALLGKTLIMVESLCASLDPDFEPLSAAQPVIKAVREQKINPAYFIPKFWRKTKNLSQTISELPNLFFSILRKVESGNFKIQFIHRELEGATRELEHSINRLAWAILLSAIIIAATLLLVRLGIP